ncbi:hypothetical protein DSO57_1032290 [Entomophthora muscae]|uniref:Uncharacterized protein n=1 Tax=Entomophthora muscae TaxID=34485 RepID=A0ACC2UA90_9FUNG|nr:hypothetical protein DSO57_1032290 [Entomophthora muscae]
MTLRNGLLLGLAGSIFIFLMTSLNLPSPLTSPTLLHFINRFDQDARFKSPPTLKDSIILSGLYRQFGKGYDPSPPIKKSDVFHYRSLKNSKHFIVPIFKENKRQDTREISSETRKETESLSAQDAINQEETLGFEEGGNNSLTNIRLEDLFWVEVGDDPASLKDGFPNGVVQFYSRPLEPLLDIKSNKELLSNWKKNERHFLNGNLINAFYDNGFALSVHEKGLGPTLTVAYEIYDSALKSSRSWLRVYYMGYHSHPNLDILLDGIGPIETLTVSRGAVTYSRVGDHVMFWTGNLPNCTRNGTSCYEPGQLLNVLPGPPTSRRHETRSQLYRKELSSPSFFTRIDSLNANEVAILTSSVAFKKKGYFAQTSTWTSSPSGWALTLLDSDSMTFQPESYNGLEDYVSPETLFDSVHESSHLPSPLSISLPFSTLVHLPYSKPILLVEYRQRATSDSPKKVTFFDLAKLEMVAPSDTVSVLYSELVEPGMDEGSVRVQPLSVQEDPNMSYRTLGRRIEVDQSGRLVAIQYGSCNILTFSYIPAHTPGEDAPPPEPRFRRQVPLSTQFQSRFLLSGEDINFSAIKAILPLQRNGMDYIIVLHSHAALTSWQLKTSSEPSALSDFYAADRLAMVLAMVIVTSLFVSNEISIPLT